MRVVGLQVDPQRQIDRGHDFLTVESCPHWASLVRCTDGAWVVPGHRSTARAVTGWPLALARRPGWVYLDVDIYRRIGPTTICFLKAVRPVEPRRL